MHSPILESAFVWHDLVPRTGAMNMAIDQTLFEHGFELPILRFYSWEKPTISLGYFQSLKETKRHFPDEKLEFIRRWTGGGSVDHRIDHTYTLIIPRKHPWSNLSGALSYQTIHQAIATALNHTETLCSLADSSMPIVSNIPCFKQPVEYDIINNNGKKLAGAGQKRNRQGLLHQGSVIDVTYPNLWKDEFIKLLTLSAITWTPETDFESQDSFEHITSNLAKTRYESTEWLMKRP